MALTAWRTFVTVCRLGSLSAAAAELGYTQSAVSRQIAGLEREIGVPLVERHPRGIRLTAAGEAFRQHAQAAVNEADRAVRAARDARDGSPARPLAVGATPSLAAGLVPAAMRSLLDEAGPLPWRLVPGLTAELCERTVNRELDLALVTDAPPGLPDDSRLERQLLGTDEMMVVLPIGHRLAGGGPARIEELAGETWAEDNEGSAALLRQHAARAGVTARIDLNAADLPGKIALVATGHAVALTPSVMVTTLRADVATLRLFDPPTRGIYSVRPRLDPHPSAETLIRHIAAIISLPIGRVGRRRRALTDVTLRVLPDTQLLLTTDVRPSAEADQEGAAPVIESDLVRRPVWPGRAMTAGLAIVAVAVMAVAAAAERSRLAGSLTVLARLHWMLLPVGILLEAMSMAAFAAMFRLLLTRGRVRPTRTTVLATIYAANAMSVSVPLAGPGLAAAYLFRRFTRLGAGALLAGWALLAGGVISAVAWVLLLVGGGLASGRTLALVIALPCVALAVIVAALIGVAARRPRLRGTLEGCLAQALKLGARLLRWPATDPMLALRAWAERFRALRIPPSTWVLATGDALVNWLADAAVLAVSILAVGAAVPWRDLLLVYLAGIGAQSLSLTPGGLAITEGAISVALVASGLRVGQAVAAAVLYRLVSFWLIAAVGWLILLVLRIRTPAAQAAPEPELEPAPVDSAAGAGAATEPGPHELVLLHGQPGTAADWEAVIERLPPQLHAVAVDRPGYGSSQRQAAGFNANAQAVLDDLDERGVETAVLVGHSWAGGVALQAAALAPHRVKAVVLLAGVGPGSVSIVDWLLAAPIFGPLSAQLMWRWTPWIARTRLAWLTRRHGKPLYPGENVFLQVWGQKGGGVEPLWRVFLTEQRALLSELADLEAVLPSIGVPVLLLADPADQIVPIMTAQRLESELPDARLRLVEHAGHDLPRRAPGAVAQAIAEFLAPIEAGQPAENLSFPG